MTCVIYRLLRLRSFGSPRLTAVCINSLVPCPLSRPSASKKTNQISVQEVSYVFPGLVMSDIPDLGGLELFVTVAMVESQVRLFNLHVNNSQSNQTRPLRYHLCVVMRLTFPLTSLHDICVKLLPPPIAFTFPRSSRQTVIHSIPRW